MDEHTIKHRVLSGFAWEAGSRLLIQIASWGSTVLVARLLAPEDYGFMAIAGAVTLFLEMVMELGLSKGIIQQRVTTHEQEDGVFYISFGLASVFYALLWMAAPAIAEFYRMPILAQILPVLGITLILSSIKVVPLALALQQLNFRYRALVQVAATLFSSLTALAFAMAGHGVWAIVASLLVLHTVNAIGYLPLYRRFPRPWFRWSEMKGLMRFGVSSMGSALLYFWWSRAEFLIAGRYLGKSPLGQYSIAHTLAEIPLEKMGTLFFNVAFPTIAQMKDERARAQAYFLTMHRYLVTLAFPVLLGLAMVADDLVPLLLTDKWAPAIPIIQVFCIANLLKISAQLMSPTLLGLGKPDTVLGYNFLCAILLPIAAFIGVQYGLMPMVYALALTNIPIYAYVLRAVLRSLGLAPSKFISSFKSAMFASIFMTVATLGAKLVLAGAPAILRLAVVVAVGVVSYGGFYLVFYRDQLREVKEGLQLLRKGRSPEPAPQP